MFKKIKKCFNSLFRKISIFGLKIKTKYFIRSIKNSNKFFIKFFLRRKANINCKDKNGKTMLRVVIDDLTHKNRETEGGYIKRKIDMIHFLVANGADLNLESSDLTTALQYACKTNNYEIAKELLKLNCNINYRNKDGYTALLYACEYNWKKLAIYLLKKGANLNIPAMDGTTCLHAAVQNGNEDFIKLLVEKGIDINASDNSKVTPLHLACMTENFELVDYLISNGAKIDVSTAKGKTPLHIACENNYNKIACYLIFRGANVNATTNNSSTPIHYVCKNNNVELLKFLISCNVNLDLRNSKNESPLRLCIQNGNIRMTQILIQCGADVHSLYDKGWQLIHYAAKYNHKNMILLLEEYGANLKSKTYDNLTPSEICKKHKNKKLYEFINCRIKYNVSNEIVRVNKENKNMDNDNFEHEKLFSYTKDIQDIKLLKEIKKVSENDTNNSDRYSIFNNENWCTNIVKNIKKYPNFTENEVHKIHDSYDVYQEENSDTLYLIPKETEYKEYNNNKKIRLGNIYTKNDEKKMEYSSTRGMLHTPDIDNDIEYDSLLSLIRRKEQAKLLLR